MKKKADKKQIENEINYLTKYERKKKINIQERKQETYKRTKSENGNDWKRFMRGNNEEGNSFDTAFESKTHTQIILIE